MVTRIASALGRLATGVSSTALEALGDLAKHLPGEAQIVSLIERAALQFEKIEVVVTCRPTGPGTDDYALTVDLEAFEAALTAGRIAQPKIVVVAATTDLDRALLTERLIEAFVVVLQEHQARMESVKGRRERRLKKEAEERTSFIGEMIELLFWLLLFPIAGLGAAVGTIFWLIVGFGGIVALMELPTLVLSAIKRSIGLAGDAEETELQRLEQNLKRYEAVLLQMVTKATITTDEELAALRQQF